MWSQGWPQLKFFIFSVLQNAAAVSSLDRPAIAYVLFEPESFMQLSVYLGLLVSKNMSQYLTNTSHYSSVVHSLKGILVLEVGLQQLTSCVSVHKAHRPSHIIKVEIFFPSLPYVKIKHTKSVQLTHADKHKNIVLSAIHFKRANLEMN